MTTNEAICIKLGLLTNSFWWDPNQTQLMYNTLQAIWNNLPLTLQLLCVHIAKKPSYIYILAKDIFCTLDGQKDFEEWMTFI